MKSARRSPKTAADPLPRDARSSAVESVPRTGSSSNAGASPFLLFCNQTLDLKNWKRRCLRFLHGEGIVPAAALDDMAEEGLGKAEGAKRMKEDKEAGGDVEEGSAAMDRFHFKGGRVTFGKVERLHAIFRDMLDEVAAKGRFIPRHTELLNTALSQAGGLRFHLDRIIPARRERAETLHLNPRTFDLSILLLFFAARFFSGIDPSRLRRCPHCGGFFVPAAMRRKRFCADSCRLRYHNRVRVESGKQARYMRTRRARMREAERKTPA
ncbi:MAG: hypothetical protein V3V62_02860 [bacterium]